MKKIQMSEFERNAQDLINVNKKFLQEISIRVRETTDSRLMKANRLAKKGKNFACINYYLKSSLDRVKYKIYAKHKGELLIAINRYCNSSFPLAVDNQYATIQEIKNFYKRSLV